MASLVNMRFACEQVSLPVCAVLFSNKVHARYPARIVRVGPLNVCSPYTALFLALVVWLSVVLVKRTSKMYSFPARKEMLLFLSVYTAAVATDLVLCCGVIRMTWGPALPIIVSFQLACFVACFVALMCTGLVWTMPDRVSGSCVGLSRMFTLFTLAVTWVVLLGLNFLSFGFGVFALLFVVPAFFSGLFALTQLAKLRQLRAEIWSYGALLVAAVLAALIALTPYVLGMVIVMVSDRYLDGLFLIHVFSFFAVLQVYGLWSLDNEKEIEYVNTIKQ